MTVQPKRNECLRNDGLVYDTHDIKWSKSKLGWFCWWCKNEFVEADYVE